MRKPGTTLLSFLSAGVLLGFSLSAQSAGLRCADAFTATTPQAASTQTRPVLSVVPKTNGAERRDLPRAARDPFFGKTGRPFDAIDFSKIQNGDFAPAFETAIAECEARLEKIRRNTLYPTFENTIEALEAYNEPLERVRAVFAHYVGVKSSPELSALSKTIYPRLSKLNSSVSYDVVLRDRVQRVVNELPNLKLTAEQQRLTRRTLQTFGAMNRTPEVRARLAEIDARLGALSTDFSDALTRGRGAFSFAVSDAKDLGDLPADLLASAKKRAEEKGLANQWLFSFSESGDLLAHSPNRLLRKKLWVQRARIGGNRSESDNRARVIEIAKLREERAHVVGATNYASWKIGGRMAKTPENVVTFLMGLAEKYRPAALQDKKELEDFAGHTILPWDVGFYTTRLKEKKFGYDEESLRAYFPLDRVLEGFFFSAKKLYGVTFVARPDLPTWDAQVRAFEVKDRDGKHLAIFYLDPFERPGQKRSGAWANSLAPAGRFDGQSRRPSVINVMNIKAPAAGQPALLTLDNVITLFHEGGHGLHNILSRTQYREFSGTHVAWDFVELPSQFMENFALQPEVLDVYARHYKTGERIPADLIERVRHAQNFRAGVMGLSQVRMALLDISWHTRDLSAIEAPADLAKFEKEVLTPHMLSPTFGLLSSTTFSHAFSGGYDAGYYSYKWADVLASDAFEAFEENGIFDPGTSDRFAKSILEKGGLEPADKLYRDFRGRDADPEALLRREGLLPPRTAAPPTSEMKPAA